MLFAFAHAGDLRACANNLDAYDNDCISFQAFPHSTDSTGATFFALTIQNKKVEAVEDWRTLSELKENFPKLSAEAEVVWKNQRSWNSCFDVLSSLVKSHQRILIDNFEDGFEAADWPCLRSQTVGNQSDVSVGKTPNIEGVCNAASPLSSCALDCNDVIEWTLVRLDTLSLSPSRPIAGGHSYLDLSEEEEGEWALIGSQQQQQQQMLSVSPKRSYRDVLLSASEIQHSDSSDAVQAHRPRDDPAPWQPSIVLAQHAPHRRYESALPGAGEEEEEEEEERWALCCSGAGYAQSVPAKRLLNSSRVKPRLLDKKLRRIALKGH
jgi:hypothetical protein